MPQATHAVTGFLGGEISQFAQGRFDDPKYKISLNVCLNWIPAEAGTLTPRPGTAYAGHTRLGAPAKVAKWDFDAVVPYTLEFTDTQLRFRVGLQFVCYAGLTVSSISTADPAVVTVTGTAPPSASTVIFANLGTACPLLQNRQFVWTNTGGSTGTIADAITNVGINGATLGVSGLGANAVMARIYEVFTGYASGSWKTLQVIQADAVGICVNGTKAPQALTVATPPTALANATFAFNPAIFEDGPYLDPFTNGVQATPNATNGIVTLTLAFPAYSSTTSYAKGDFVTSASVNYESLVDQNVNNTPASSPSDWAAVAAAAAINNGQGFLGTDIGRLVRLLSEPAAWLAGSTYSAGNVVSYNPTGEPGASTYWQSLTGSNTGNVPGADLKNWELVQPGAALPAVNNLSSPTASAGPAQWTWGEITSLANFIAGNVSGVAHIGTMTASGGNAAAFNGTTSQGNTSCAVLAAAPVFPTPGLGYLNDSYVGQNYTGGSPASYAMDHVTIFPSSDIGFVEFSINTPGTVVNGNLTCTFVLYASNSPPSAFNNGTALGTATIFTGGNFPYGISGFGNTPVTIVSSDHATAYAYWWVAQEVSFAVVGTSGILFNTTIQLFNIISQVQFFQAVGTGSSAAAINVEILGPPLLYTAAIGTWRLGKYSNTTGWPSTGTYAGGRLWLAGPNPGEFDASTTDDITTSGTVNFAPTDQYGGVNDNNGISYKFKADGTNPIFWMKPVVQNQALRGIVMGTQAREWFVFPPTGGPITATNIDAIPATKNGCANVLPVETEHTFIFVQRYSVKALEYFSDVFSGKFTAPNLMQDDQHITRAGIAELAYTHATTPIIWGRCNDGTLFGITYKRDTLMTASGPTYKAGHRHQLGSGRTVESLCAGPSVGGNLDALTMVTSDSAVRHVEVLTDQLDELTTLAQSWFVDDGIVPTSTVSSVVPVSYPFWASGTTYAQGAGVLYTDGNVYFSLVNGNVGNKPPSTLGTDWLLGSAAPYGGLTLNGLWPHNGKVVSVFAGGLDCGDYIVANGSILVPYGDGISWGTGGGLFTTTFVGTNPAIIVGFTYNKDGQLVRPQMPPETGARNGPALGKKRRVHKVSALVNNLAMGNVRNQSTLSIGRDFAHLMPVIIGPETVPNQARLTPGQTFSGVFQTTIGDESSYDGMVAFRNARPLPGNIPALQSFLETQDE